MMSNTILSVYKPLGWTPLQLLEHLKKETPALRHEKLSYAGRLDPMAEGAMLVLVGEANKEREKYLSLSKTYRFEILFGFATDSYDLLGLVKSKTTQTIPKPELGVVLPEIQRRKKMPYPTYSSKTVAGKPLWWWAKNNRLEEIRIPERDIVIKKLEQVGLATIPKAVVRSEINRRITLVSGDFRQSEILKKWASAFEGDSQESYWLATIDMACTSGTYVRSVVQEIGQILHVPTCTYSIIRTSIG